MNAKVETPRRMPSATIGNVLALLGLLALALAFLPLHDDAWWLAPPLPAHWAWAAAAVASYAAASGWLLRRSRPRPPRERPAVGGDAPLLVAWASQTGFAEELAERTAATLAGAGLDVRLRELADVDAA